MKYKKLTLSLNYEKYSEESKDTLNSYIKNRVYYSMGEFHIYVDNGKEEYGRNKIVKEMGKKITETLKQIA